MYVFLVGGQRAGDVIEIVQKGIFESKLISPIQSCSNVSENTESEQLKSAHSISVF